MTNRISKHGSASVALGCAALLALAAGCGSDSGSESSSSAAGSGASGGGSAKGKKLVFVTCPTSNPNCAALNAGIVKTVKDAGA